VFLFGRISFALRLYNLMDSVEEMMKTALARLRAKTDQDLSVLIARQLKRSLADAHRGKYQQAAKGYHAARALLAVADIPPTKREQLCGMLAELRSHIELPASAVA
jgi:hypothetical protein